MNTREDEHVRQELWDLRRAALALSKIAEVGHPPALRRWTVDGVMPCADELQFGSRVAERDPKRPSRLSLTASTVTLAYTCRAFDRASMEREASVLLALGFRLMESER